MANQNPAIPETPYLANPVEHLNFALLNFTSDTIVLNVLDSTFNGQEFEIFINIVFSLRQGDIGR